MRRLTADDTDRVAALFHQNFRQLPVGDLTPRSRCDFGRILCSQNVSVGSFAGDALTGYQLSDQTMDLDYDAQRYPNGPNGVAGQRCLFGKGAMIEPGWRGKGLGRRLRRELEQLARREGYRHLFSQIFISNYDVVRWYLTGENTIAGLSTDRFGRNFIGRLDLCNSVAWVKRGECAIDDPEGIAAVLEHYTITATRGQGRKMALIYSQEAVTDGQAKSGPVMTRSA